MRIIIAYDGSGNSRYSLDKLRMSGLPHNAEVFITAVSEIWLSPQLKQVKDFTYSYDILDYFQKHSEQMNRNLAETKAILSEAAEILHGYFPDWKIKTEAVSGSAARQILSKALAFKAALIVVGAQGLSSDNSEKLGGVSNKILAEAQCSVRFSKMKREPDSKILRVAICFDGSPDSIKAVEEVASRNWQQKIEIRLITVTDFLNPLIPGRVLRVIPGLPEGKMSGEKKWIDSLAEGAMEMLDNADYHSELKIYSGNPRIVLVDEISRWGADLIFIGANSGQAEKFTLGSVAWSVAAGAFCTVEIIRGNL